MSSDDGYLVQRNSKGKWHAQHYFLSADLPLPDEKAVAYQNVEDCILVYSNVAAKTEYGFNIIHNLPPTPEDRVATPEEEATLFVDNIPVGFSEQTLHKVYESFIDNGVASMQLVQNIINTMQNKGILFRERI